MIRDDLSRSPVATGDAFRECTREARRRLGGHGDDLHPFREVLDAHHHVFIALRRGFEGPREVNSPPIAHPADWQGLQLLPRFPEPSFHPCAGVARPDDPHHGVAHPPPPVVPLQLVQHPLHSKVLCRDRVIGKAWRISTRLHTDGSGV